MNNIEKEEAIRRIEEHIRIHFAKEYPRAVKITEALNMAVNALKDQANAKSHCSTSRTEPLRSSDELAAVKCRCDAAVADLYKAADCSTCGYRDSGCRAKTHEDEMNHSCYKWRGEMEFLNERRTDDD